MTTISPFVRFNTVRLCYYGGVEEIKEKCEWITMLLRPLKHPLNGSKFHFQGAVSDRLYYFNDNAMLSKHIEEELLPICSACSSYNFEIW